MVCNPPRGLDLTEFKKSKKSTSPTPEREAAITTAFKNEYSYDILVLELVSLLDLLLSTMCCIFQRALTPWEYV